MGVCVRVARLSRWLAGFAVLAVLVGGMGRAVGQGSLKAAVGTLDGKVVVVDPGHGGRDGGAIGGGVIEKDVTLAIGLLFRDMLEKAGVQVIMTRTSDTDLSGLEDVEVPQRQRWRQGLVNRSRVINDSGADIFISIHANAVGSPRWSGAQAFYNPQRVPDSSRLAATIQEELVEITGRTERAASSKIHQYILEEAQIPGATVEVGFLSNPRERQLLTTPAYQQELAWAMFLGVARYFAESDRPSARLTPGR